MASILIFAGFTLSHAQTPVGKEERRKVVETVSRAWNDDWQQVSLSGKFKMGGLPLSPTVKIFMERDSSIMLSLRAPLMGEVGRAEIAGDTILVVNKMKKTYVKEPIEKALAYYPGTLTDLQDLLLGRVVIPGYGLLGEEISGKVELFPEEDGQYSLIPGEEAQLETFNYGYLIDAENSLTKGMVVVPVDKPDIYVSLTYGHHGDGYDIDFMYKSPKKIYMATLQLDAPNWDGTPIDPIKINQRYRRMTFKEFMESF